MIHPLDALASAYPELVSRSIAALKIVHAQTVGQRCEALLDFYRLAKKAIVANPHGWGIDPYEVLWTEVFTPIEAAMWHELRREGLVFYPQLPVGGAFVDFGNPHHKIAIECDGKEFHLDWKRDRERDAMLLQRGWTTYRISGSECLAEVDEFDYEAGPTPIRQFVIDMAVRMGVREQQQEAA